MLGNNQTPTGAVQDGDRQRGVDSRQETNEEGQLREKVCRRGKEEEKGGGREAGQERNEAERLAEGNGMSGGEARTGHSEPPAMESMSPCNR